MKELIFLLHVQLNGNVFRSCQELCHVRLTYDYAFWVGVVDLCNIDSCDDYVGVTKGDMLNNFH